MNSSFMCEQVQMGHEACDGNIPRSVPQIRRHSLVLLRRLAADCALHVFTAHSHRSASSACGVMSKLRLFDLCSST